VITGQSPVIDRSTSGVTLAVGDVLRTCPIAVLVSA
jgi:hypothetical protein